MMKWFKHMTNMRHDVRIKRLIRKYGIEGYGLYNAVVESIAESLETDSPIPDLEENSEDIAEYFKMNVTKVEEILFFCLSEHLFDQDEVTGKILCQKIYKFIEASQTRSEEIRAMIAAYNKRATKRLEMSETVLDKSEEQNRTENKRIYNEQDNNIINIYNHYLSLDIIKHTKLTESIKRKIKSSLREYSLKEICRSLDNYAYVLKDDGSYFTHKYTLKDFLSRKIDTFLSDESRENYKKSGNYKSSPQTEEIDYEARKRGAEEARRKAEQEELLARGKA